ncbi:hypothetical protein CFN78_04050 [Amycolatopsis antarctica]|uniref:Sortase n=1 Tax=Amycolatopsis antarctica TaxID=1854586 RepID=A0A263D778_9PSEU|nr:hypothetical protein [Amycolatopsis antarctica]OZM74320.1 hypothetical protein CFN78_04050 [Amycolatopsis antarctica]
MTRFVTKLAVTTAAFALAAAPVSSVAWAQDSSVDEASGPVAYANAAGSRVSQDGVPGDGTVITETQRSPLRPGVSTLAQTRSVIPKDEGEAKSVGPNYVLSFGEFGEQSPFPGDVPSRAHRVTASLGQNTVPSAEAEATYALQDNGRGGGAAMDNTVLVLENARSTVECAGAEAATAATTADRVLVRQQAGEDRQGTLAPVQLPADGAPLELTGLPFGAPLTVDGADPAVPATSDLRISRLTSFDDLIRQDQWRGGELTRAAAWQVDVVSHVTLAAEDGVEPEVRDIRTKLVLGGVSCSTAAGFVPLAGGGAQKPSVPVKIPAGPAAGAQGPDDGKGAHAESATLLGIVLIAGGATAGGAAVFLLRRARSAKR